MDGNGYFAQLPVVPSGHEKDVEALLQIVPLILNHQVRISRLSIATSANACSEHLTFRDAFPTLAMETLSRTLPTQNRIRTEKSTLYKLSSLQILQFSAKGLANDWLTV